jgi:hypothetical protein
MLTTDRLLLADLGETLRVVLPIVFVVIYGVAHLVGALQQEQKKRAKRPQRHPLDAGPGRPERDEPAGAKPAGLEETLRREVEEFLKRAQGGAAAAAPAQRPGAKQRPRSTARPPPRRLSRRVLPNQCGVDWSTTKNRLPVARQPNRRRRRA